MQLTEQQRKNLIHRQKAFEAAVKAHELLEAVCDQFDTLTSGAQQGSLAYIDAEKLWKRVEAMKNQAFKLLCDIQCKPNHTIITGFEPLK